MFSFLYTLFSLLLVLGLLIVVGDGYWYLRFRKAASELRRYNKGYVIPICPVCHGQLHLTEVATTRFGIPSVKRSVACNQCQSLLQEVGIGQWRWQVDANTNAEMDWLYGDEIVSDKELLLVASGQHTDKAEKKIAERKELERKRKRAEALEEVSRGNWATLASLSNELVEAPVGTSVMYGATIGTPLALQGEEKCLLVVKGSALGETRTRQNAPYLHTVDQGGAFFVTTKRYGYVGAGKTTTQKLGVIEKVEVSGSTLTVYRSNRKTPEHFSGLDVSLAKAVLDGVRRTP